MELKSLYIRCNIRLQNKDLHVLLLVVCMKMTCQFRILGSFFTSYLCLEKRSDNCSLQGWKWVLICEPENNCEWNVQPERSVAYMRPSEAREKTAGGVWGGAVSPPTGSGAEPLKILHFYASRLPKYRISSVPKHQKLEGQSSSKITWKPQKVDQF